MTRKLLSVEEFHQETLTEGVDPDAMVFRFSTAEAQAVDGAARTKRFIFSDGSIDHAGDSIDPLGWDLSVFSKNPVALFSHMSWEPPIGRASNVGFKGGKLVGDIEFATAEIYEFADTIYRLVDGGFLKAVSVGFKPKVWSFVNDPARPNGIDFKKQTLLEISVCAVPCNPNALSQARSKGIDTKPLREWAERVLDGGEIATLPRHDLEALYRNADGRPAPLHLTVRSHAREDRIREAAALRASLTPKAVTTAERLSEASNIRRALEARGLI